MQSLGTTESRSDTESLELEPAPPVPAPLNRRLANFVLDCIVVGVVKLTLDAISIELALPIEVTLANFLLALTSCYVLPEWLFGRTFGKLVTGTKVVCIDGERPSLWSIVLRTVVRFVPFEPWSFVLGRSTGWHDDWARTRVVQARDPYAAMVRRLR